MVAASLLHYLRDRRLRVALVAAVAVLLACLVLLAYVVFLGAQTSDPTLDVQLIGPFRWLEATAMG